MAQLRVNLTLPTFLIGPEARGRGYGLLADCGAMADAEDQVWAADLAMMLAAWADSGENDFIACLPIRSGASRILARAHYAGHAELGSVAFLNGAVLGSSDLAALDYRPERVIGSIPVPDGTQSFANHPLKLAQFDADLGIAFPDLGLAWHHRLIVTDGSLDPQSVLCAALQTVNPESQRAHIGGWITSARLPARGTLDPASDCALVIADEAPQNWRGGHLVAPLKAGVVTSQELPLPPAYQAWLALKRASDGRIAANMQWRAGWRDASPETVIAEQLRLLTSEIDLAEMTGFLCSSARSPSADHAAAARVVISEYFIASRAGQQEGKLLVALADREPLDIGTFLAAAAMPGAKLDPRAIADETLIPLLTGIIEANALSAASTAQFLPPLVLQAWNAIKRKQGTDLRRLADLVFETVLAWPQQYLSRDLGFLANRGFFAFVIANRPDLVTQLSRDILHLRPSDAMDHPASGAATSILRAMLLVLRWLESQAGALRPNPAPATLRT